MGEWDRSESDILRKFCNIGDKNLAENFCTRWYIASSVSVGEDYMLDYNQQFKNISTNKQMIMIVK